MWLIPEVKEEHIKCVWCGEKVKKSGKWYQKFCCHKHAVQWNNLMKGTRHATELQRTV
jgi:hypothetical protein